MKKYSKMFASLAIVSMFALMPLMAQGATVNLWGNASVKANTQGALGLGTKDIRETIAAIINIALGLLGIVAVVIVLMGGFRWMTAGGEQGKVDEAKKLITSGIIGLAIIVSAYAIAQFVIDSLMTATQ